MLDKLDAIKARFEQVGIALTNPEIINNQKEYGAMSKEYRSLEKIVQPYETYRRVMADYEFAKESLNGSDEDMRELAKMELPELELKKDELEKALTKLLIPKDPQDDKNAILEIRAGTGGDEASLFAVIYWACTCVIVVRRVGKPILLLKVKALLVDTKKW